MAQDTVLEESPVKTRKTRARRIQRADIESMATLISERLTDKEACLQLAIPYTAWRNWLSKARSQPHLDDIVSRLRGAKVLACMKGIESAGTKDWRALRERLSLLDHRFNDRIQQAVNNTQINVWTTMGIDMDRLLADGYSKAKRPMVEVQEVKQLQIVPPNSN